MKKPRMKPNFTQIPNVILDNMHVLSPAEFKVIVYICRRTYGFQKDSDKISISQLTDGIKKKDGDRLDGGTGLSKQGVINSISKLIEIGLIKSKKSKNGTSEYSIIGTGSQLIRLADEHELVNSVDDSSQLSVQEVVNSVYIQNKEKESIQKKDTSEETSHAFSLSDEIKKLDDNPRRDMQVIGWYMSLRLPSVKKNVTSKEQLTIFIKRYLKTAGQLKNYTDEQLIKAGDKCKQDYKDIDWTLETVLKVLTK